MSNYISIYHKTGDLLHRCKFNLSESLAETVLTSLHTYFELELAQGTVTRKQGRIIVEISVTEPNAEIIKQAFLSQLPIYQNQN